MKITREQLHYFIDAHKDECSVEETIVYLVCTSIERNPDIIPYLMEQLGLTMSAITDRQLRAFRICEERATYLEAYLDGKMYTEEYNNKPEYVEIQKGHATAIKDKCRNMLNIK